MKTGIWIVVAAMPFYIISIFAGIPLLATRPIAPLTTACTILVCAAALASIAVLPRSQPRSRRLRRLLTFALLTPLGMLLLVPMFICACIKAPMRANQAAARMFLVTHQNNVTPDKQPKDTYGGHFHCDGDGPGARVWSDGPDLLDNKGKISVVRRIRSFEAAWQTNFGDSFLDSIQNGVRSVALAELVTLWGRLNGDIVWQVGTDGQLTAIE
jgi:hypothetical protein